MLGSRLGTVWAKRLGMKVVCRAANTLKRLPPSDTATGGYSST